MNQELDEEEAGGGGFLNHLPAILWQRRWLLLIPLVLLSVAGVVAAFTMPTVYRSKAVLAVESAELPREVVGSPVTALIDQRIARIRQQVLSRGNLVEIIQQNNLYAEERASTPLSQIIERMREATVIEAIEADLGQSNGESNTIAFAMSFDYESPAEAQVVMQEFVERFLDEDSSRMAQQADSTVEFLTEQAGGLQRQIVALEDRITDIKARNGLALTASMMPSSSNTASYDAQIAALQRENNLLMQRARMQRRDPAVAAAEAQLAAARAIYSDSHPDVRIAQQRLAEAQRSAAADPANDEAALAANQIASNHTQIAALSRARSMELAQTSAVTGAQARAPVVMEEIAQLETRADALRTQYQDVANKLLSARTAVKMETEQKGERLSVTDPPVVPDSPTSPNRPLLVLGGIVAGALAGLGLALLVELMLRPIRDVSEVERLLGMPPLVVIPTLGKPSLRERLRFWRRKPRAPDPVPAE